MANLRQTPTLRGESMTWWKRVLCLVCSCLCLGLAIPWTVQAAEDTETTEVVEEEEEEASKGEKIAGFLIIFTICFVAAAYAVMRPSLKKLKAAKQAQKDTVQTPEETTPPAEACEVPTEHDTSPPDPENP